MMLPNINIYIILVTTFYVIYKNYEFLKICRFI